MYLSNEECILAAERYAEDNDVPRVARDYSIILEGTMLPNSKIRIMREGDLLVTQEELMATLERFNTAAQAYNEKKAELDKVKAQFEQDHMMLIFDVQELEEEYSVARFRVEDDTKKYLGRVTFSDEDIPF